MFRTTHTGAFLSLIALLITGTAAQESADFHQFTDKKGQRVSAMLLEVSADRQQMKIRREDGQEFETVINLLSLDDQQYVKDWMKNAPQAGMMKTDFLLNLSLSRQTGSVEKHTQDNIVLEQRPTTFRMTVRNLSRDSLEGARLEYVLVWEDRTRVYQTEAQSWTYIATSDEEEEGAPPLVKEVGQMDLELLRFNGEATLETASVNMEQVFIGDNKPFREDEMIGVKVRILAKDGAIIHEASSGGAVIAAMKWDEASALPDPMVLD
ncbi:MAG: hypothetical protein NWR21_02280 [Verrucomicrobiales bacterium]|jgi:hypothetical protein|nr:hypothetical protein [Verrucomicrobiales bacterium]